MIKNIGIHVLTAYPPSNPNRDEDGSPKTAIVAGVTRQRISSQCIKRAWRLSDIMAEFDHSTRTRSIGCEAEAILLKNGIEEEPARQWATAIANTFGSVSKKNPPENSEMVTFGKEELAAVAALAETLSAEKRAPTKKELDALQKKTVAVDVALFGRMRAAAKLYNVDASVYVSHPLTTGRVKIENDYWTAVDDLKNGNDETDAGAGGMGDVEFGAGTFYAYIQVNAEALAKNLGGENATPESRAMANKVILKLVEAIANVSPSGHKTTFGNEVRASFVRIEIGATSGNLFCKAYEEPVTGTTKAIEALKVAADKEAQAFGLERKVFEFTPPQSLSGMLENVNQALSGD
jgi:CRISPR system Cascade subunit CasC